MVDSDPQSRIPVWLFNDRIDLKDGAGWLHLPTKVLHPTQIPLNLRMEHCVVLLVTGPPEGLVISAVRSGVFLTVAQLKSLHAVIKFKLPEKGSGKNGNIIKVDWVRALVNHYFRDSPEDIRMNMMKGMLGQSWKHLNPGRASKHSGDILRAFNGIDVADMKEYVDIAQVAADEEVLKEKRLQRERKVGYHMAARKHFTPKVLKEVIPAECRISRHPPLKRYQAFYGSWNQIQTISFFGGFQGN